MGDGSCLGDLKHTASEMKISAKKHNMRSDTARLLLVPPSAQQPDAQTRSTYAPVEMLGLGRSVERLWAEQEGGQQNEKIHPFNGYRPLRVSRDGSMTNIRTQKLGAVAIKS